MSPTEMSHVSKITAAHRPEHLIDVAAPRRVRHTVGIAEFCAAIGLDPTAWRAVFTAYKDHSTPWNMKLSGESAVRESALWYLLTLGRSVYLRVQDGELWAVYGEFIDGYKNWWSADTAKQSDAELRQMFDRAAINAGYLPGNEIERRDAWSLNGHIARLYKRVDQQLGDTAHWWSEMFSECAKTLPNCEFLYNVDDFPRHARRGGMPWAPVQCVHKEVLDDEGHVIPFRMPENLVSPVSSCTDSTMYSDALAPTGDDWALTVVVERGNFPFPPWKKRTDRAVFRGSSTGAAQDNVRASLAEISRAEGASFIDAGITKWTSSMRYEDGAIRCAEPTTRPIPTMPSKTQVERYKYVLCPDGHVAPYRLSDLFYRGACVMRQKDSSWQLWYDEAFKKYTLWFEGERPSSVIELVEWCRLHDEECRSMARKAASRARKMFTRHSVVQAALDAVSKVALPLDDKYSEDYIAQRREAL